MKGYSLLLAAWVSFLLNGTVHAIQKRTLAHENGTPGVVSIQFQRRSGLIRRAGTVQTSLVNKQISYSVILSLGTPPQSVSVQLDTGSSDLVVNPSTSTICTTNPSACGAGMVYSANASSTYQYVDSTFSQLYQDQTGGSGDYALDSLSIGGSGLTGVEFGLAYQSNLTEGVLGVSYVETESNSKGYDNLPVLLVKQGLIATRAFSLYLNDIGATSGTLLFGGIDTAKYTGSLTTVPFVPSPGSGLASVTEFYVALNSVSGTDSNGNPVTLAGGSGPLTVLLDSGTTQTMLPSALVTSIWNLFGATANPQAGNSPIIPCPAASDNRILNFVFSGTTIGVAFRQLATSNGDGTCSLDIIPTAAGNNNIFGDSVLRSMYIVFDLDNHQAQIAAANLNSTSSNIVPITGGSSSTTSSSSSTTATSSSTSAGSSSIGNPTLLGSITTTLATTPTTSATSIGSSTGASGLSSVTSGLSTATSTPSTTTASTNGLGSSIISGSLTSVTSSSVSTTGLSTTTVLPTSLPTSPSPLFVYAGCFSNGLSGFVTLGTNSSMTVDLCLSLALANGYAYAALNNNTCFGGQALNTLAASAVSNSQCNIPCSGNPAQACGGGSSAPISKRQLAILISVYVRVGATSSTTTLSTALSVVINVATAIQSVAGTFPSAIIPGFWNTIVTVANACSIAASQVASVVSSVTGVCPSCVNAGNQVVPVVSTIVVGCTACANGANQVVTTVTTITSPTGIIVSGGSPGSIVTTIAVPGTPAIPTGKTNGTYTGLLVGASGAGTVKVGGMVILAFGILSYFVMY